MKLALLLALLVVTAVAYAQPARKLSERAARNMRLADSLFTARDWNGAIRVYGSVLKSVPDNSLAWNRLGYCYHSISNYERALSCYLKAIEFKPSSALESVVQARLARIYALRDDHEKAFQSLDRALQLGYCNINELESHNDFNNIRDDARFANVIKRANANAYLFGTRSASSV